MSYKLTKMKTSIVAHNCDCADRYSGSHDISGTPGQLGLHAAKPSLFKIIIVIIIIITIPPLRGR